MNIKHHRPARLAALLIFLLPCLLLSAPAQAVSTPPKEHIHFIAEHLAEAAQDAAYFAMPWPVGDYSSTGWKPLVSVAGARVDQGFAQANGQLLTLGLSRNWSRNWATQLLVYYDRFHIGGGQTSNALLPAALNGVPLDLPETAVFSSPDGEIIHSGIGIVVSHQLDFEHSNWAWDAVGGVLVEKLEMNNFTFDYQLTGGADAGATGVLDHSGDGRLVYLVMGIQARKTVAEHYTIIPRFIYGLPTQTVDMNTHLTGPGFDLSTASTGANPGRIGDAFGYWGMSLRDSHSHLEMDVGAILGYAAFEYLAHEGINSALVISLTWRMP